MKIKNITKDSTLANSAALANTFFGRLKGLLGTKSLPYGAGLIIKPCYSIHTFGMAYSIDVLFVDKNNCILKIVANLKPGKTAACKGSAYVVELPAGTVCKNNAAVGDKIIID